MTFDQYIQLISKSVTETGYDNFCPSLCIPGDEIQMDVLNTDLSRDGEESLAKDWVRQFTSPGRVLYLAYRQANRMVAVVEIIGNEVIQKSAIKVV